MIRAARELCAAIERMKFKTPVSHSYNPLDYAWSAHEAYLREYGDGLKRVVFLGMNPGPYGMVQTGVPFGEINAVRDWMKIEERIGRPHREHPRRRVEGFGCERSEVSGKRLWGLFAERFGVADNFFADHFVINYCPLAFFDMEGRNLTPDKLPASQSASLLEACDQHLRRVGEILQPEWLIGVGDFAEKRARQVFAGAPVRIGKILHPSPASPAANKNWAKRATEQLKSLGTWT
ncbi:MAG: single-stranded DNA-binding protein [Verrucomicrobia bacterium]|nr:MAG: single-stranded DNA-binding protein [Verrucomicrobiota bacterium]